jgi:uncharacterized protein YndB with AHSA1/START domain
MTDFGTVRRDGSFGAVRFERVYAAPPSELWAAWTSPERLARWMGAALSGRLRPGGTATLAWGEDAGSQVELVVTELTPPELLEWEWTVAGEAPTRLRVQFVPVPEGTRLVLEHVRLPFSMFAGLAAGWHAYLDALAVGQAAGWDAAWAELLPAYKDRVAEL